MPLSIDSVPSFVLIRGPDLPVLMDSQNVGAFTRRVIPS